MSRTQSTRPNFSLAAQRVASCAEHPEASRSTQGIVGKILQGWNWFWFSKADPFPLAVTRVGIGLIWISLLIATAPSWSRYYGADGLLSLRDTDLDLRRSQSFLSLINAMDGVVSIESWWWIGIVLAISLTVGFGTRIATIGLFLFATSLIQRNVLLVNGEEMVTRMLLFYGCFSPWGQRLSIDSWIATRRSKFQNVTSELPLVWSWRAMQINFLLIYMISVPYKLADDIDWLTGDALHWTVASDMWWSRGWWPGLTLSFDGVLRKLLTWGTILVEATFPIFVCFRRTRAVSTLGIMLLHIGIAFCIPGVTLFTLSMVVGAAMFIARDNYQQMGVFLSSIVSQVIRRYSMHPLLGNSKAIR